MRKRPTTPYIASQVEQYERRMLDHYLATRHNYFWGDWARREAAKSIAIIRSEQSFARMQMCV